MTTTPIDLHAPYKQRVADALNNKHLRTALSRTTWRMSDARINAMGAVDGARLRDQVRQMKEDVIARLPDLLEEVESKLQENGGQVHWANDAADVHRIVLDIARRANVATGYGRHPVRRATRYRTFSCALRVGRCAGHQLAASDAGGSRC